MNLHHDKEAFAELIIGAANELAIPTNVIEKDYYVTITLKALAEKTKDMVFKGGTSLTKCYQLLDRFSEDIDLSYTAESGMPVANSYDIHDVVDACKYYFAQTGRRVTFEYSLVGGVNDTAEDATELSALVHGMNCHINLIPVNPIKERDYVQSNKGVIEAFKNRLEKNGINVTIRREMGRDIDGACGQLRKKHIDKERGIN